MTVEVFLQAANDVIKILGEWGRYSAGRWRRDSQLGTPPQNGCSSSKGAG